MHSFGSAAGKGYKDSIGIMEEDGAKHILYPVGKFIAVKNFERSEMNFIKLSENLEKMECMTISPNKKFIAVSEKYYTNPKNEEGKIEK